jgi:Ti-type conjugative transfer relaxase TraA
LPHVPLSKEQEAALGFICDKGDLKSIIGFAGTGKSYLLGAANEIWDKSGFRVQGAALSGIAALNLEDSSKIESRTIASLFYRIDNGMFNFTKRDVLVVDEAGMIGSEMMARLVQEVADKGAKLVLVGDPQQLQAIEAGAAFRAICQAHNYAELNTIRRQTVAWQVDASYQLALGKVDKALEAYKSHDHVHYAKTQEAARQSLINTWNAARMQNPDEAQIMLAYTRQDVSLLNSLARFYMQQNNELGENIGFSMTRGERQFAVNDRVYFLKRNDDLGVINGSLGTIKAIDAKARYISVELDNNDLENSRQSLIHVNTAEYKYLEYGYAATVHKSQGITVDRTYLLPTSHYDAHSTYVAMTRHRKSCDIFVSRDIFTNDRDLSATLGRNRAKDISLDYSDIKPIFRESRNISEPITRDEQQHYLQRSLNFAKEYYQDKATFNLSSSKLKAFAQECLTHPAIMANLREHDLNLALNMAERVKDYAKELSPNKMHNHEKEIDFFKDR